MPSQRGSVGAVPAIEYKPRQIDGVLRDLLRELPALMVTGPRASGKTTTAARIARSEVRLDRPAEAAAFRADPDAALASMPEPVLLDEWQEVPGVLGAVKRAVDRDSAHSAIAARHHRPRHRRLTNPTRRQLPD